MMTSFVVALGATVDASKHEDEYANPYRCFCSSRLLCIRISFQIDLEIHVEFCMASKNALRIVTLGRGICEYFGAGIILVCSMLRKIDLQTEAR